MARLGGKIVTEKKEEQRGGESRKGRL